MTLRTDKLTFCYGEKPVLTTISLTFERGQFYGILGPNGCGKSTLLDLLVNHLKPHSGGVYYRERSLASIPSKALSREMALVAQNESVSFPYTVREVVTMGRHPYIARFSRESEEDRQIVTRSMAIADVNRLAGHRITELSGGERQRVMIARALAQDTPVLLLDEATSNLDIHHTISLMNRIREGVTENNHTVISVFHDINLAALYCDRLIVLKNGAVHAEGGVKDVLNERTIRDVFGVESSVRFDAYSGSNQVVFKPELSKKTFETEVSL